MARDNLLKEAIADARTVKETAVANAKLMLEETFRPTLSSMLSAKLRNEIEGGDVQETIDPGSSDIGSGLTVDEPAPKNPSAASNSSSGANGSGSETTAMGEGPVVECGDVADDEMGIDVLGTGEPEGAIDIDMAPDAEAGVDSIEGDELDLEAIIRELELDISDEEVPEPELPVEEGFDDPNAGAKVDGPITTESTNGANDKDGPGMPDVDGVPGGKEVSPGQEVTGSKAETMSESEEPSLEEILREMEADDAGVTESEKIAAENVDLKESLKKYREVVEYLRKNLNEVNMLNAKLLYSNKLFKTFELSNSQKLRVVETFDRAKTTREVKLIYSTLAESFGGTSKKSTKTTKTITEGMGSRPIGSTKPKSEVSNTDEAEVLTEEQTMRSRMQKLAGIKILNN